MAYTARITSGGVREPLSWILALVALLLAVGGLEAFTPRGIVSGYTIGIVVGFIAHELAHRCTAKRAGMESEFIATHLGLLITALSALLPIKIIAPGYVSVVSRGYLRPRSMLWSITAGPLSNIVLSAIFLGGAMVASGKWVLWLRDAGEINAWIALFNLIPLPPLDGSKVLSMNRTLWGVLAVLSLVLYLASGYVGT